MKHFFTISFLFLLCTYSLEAQTNANIAGAENVLIVYNSLDQTSIDVKEYYKNARNIPASNVFHLDSLVGKNITVNGSTHKVIIAEGGNIIRDSINHLNGTWYASSHAWKYFYQYVAAPIKDYITSNNLTSIRYIVLCKGTPFYIQAACDSTNVIANLAVDGLLAMLGTNNYDILLDSIYSKYRSYAVPNYHIWDYWQQMQITNPYYTGSAYLNMDNRFNGGVFTESWNGNTIKFDYLVSHLDGISYNIIEGMIDKSALAINSDNYDWFIDADPYPCHGYSIMVDFANSTASNLSSIGFTNYSFNTNEDTVTFHNKPIMSYSSNGVHTTKPPNIYEGQTLHPDYIQSQLNFNYPAGAIFNSAESYNAWRLSSITRASAPMGQIVEFFLKGGTVGVGHANEPFADGIIRDGVMFPAYQVGYSFIDAAYMGMPYLAWQNVVVGDPLTTIAWGKQTLTENKTLTGTNLVTGVVTVPSGKTLTVAANAVLNFKHNGSLIVNGTLVVQSGASLRFTNGAYLTINGTLNATGISTNKITFDRIGTTGTWGGIVFNSGSSGSVEYCNIYHATNGITCSSTLPMIRYNTIANNATGIYVSNVGTPSNEISYNTIQSNTYQGISLYYASPKIYSNTISGNAYYGISCRYYSSPYLYGNTITGHTSSALSCYYYSSARLVPWNAYGYYWGAGRNKIKNNTGNGISAAYMSNLYLGSSPYGGHNSIFNNTGRELSAYYNCNIMAEINYWGTPLDTTEFYAYQSTIDYTPADTIDWNPDNQSIVRGPNGISNLSTTNSVKSDLDKAYGLQSEGKFDEAIAVYDSYINANSTDSKSAYALVRIDECYKLSGKEGAATYLDNTIKTKANKSNELDAVSLELKNQYLIQDKRFEEAVNNLNKLAVTYKTNKEVEKHSLFNAGYVYLTYLNDYKNATDKFDELAVKYPDDDLVFESKYLLGATETVNAFKSVLPKTAESELIKPAKYELTQNYPNPFNPITTITYQLPKSGSVTLKIYDMLGKEVMTLVSEQKEIGKYTVQFDASSLASGMYVYQLRANDYTSTKKMLLLK
ncbi:MAG: right-handed parallel beta-helix repeat-containing protein [Ignavibacteria bacterium]|nr:right-handed parallel beta-helix repeat-containing protein [Ignavibacteria bacterium]